MRWLAALLAWMLLWAVLLRVSTDHFAAPYIYYQDAEAGIVIERVDGAHRQVIVPADELTGLITAGEWSPSGEWLAYINGGELNFRRRTDGLHRRLAEGQWWGTQGWSPTADHFLVWQAHGVGFVYAPASGEVLLFYSGAREVPLWTPDGRGIYYGGDSTLMVRSLAGGLIERQTTAYAWLPDGRLAYWDGQAVLIEDLYHGEVLRVEVPFGPAEQGLHASPDGRHLLIRPAARRWGVVRLADGQFFATDVADINLLPYRWTHNAVFVGYADDSDPWLLSLEDYTLHRVDLGELCEVSYLWVVRPRRAGFVVGCGGAVYLLGDDRLRRIGGHYYNALPHPAHDLLGVYTDTGDGAVFAGEDRYDLHISNGAAVNGLRWHPTDAWLMLSADLGHTGISIEITDYTGQYNQVWPRRFGSGGPRYTPQWLPPQVQ